MALINTLGEIGNAIREKTGGTELIPLKEMASAIRGISGGNVVDNPLEYAGSLSGTYAAVAFPDNYKLNLDVPFIRATMASLFFNTSGLTKITLKGNITGNALDMNQTFRNSTSLVEIDLTEFNVKPTNMNYLCFGDKVLQKISGVFDMSACTTATLLFNNCSALEEVRFAKETIKISMNFASSPKLSANSIQSIIDGLATVETAQALTLPKTLSTEAEAVVSANIEEIDGEIRIKGKEGWTLAR